MQAKPGPVKKVRTIAATTFVPPVSPDDLTPAQQSVWQEITSNPFLSQQDSSLITEFIRMVVLRDTAYETMQREGVLIDDAHGSFKTNPAYKIYRDTSDRLLKLRDSLLMTPKSRLQIQQGTVIQPEEADEMESLVDD